MYGAIIGDLAGSIYEYDQLKKVHPVYMKELIPSNSFYSDDTILTIAVCDAIKSHRKYEDVLKEYILKYSSYHPNFSPYFQSPFSPSLMKWARGEKDGKSCGNGAMMRISPVGYLFDCEEKVLEESRLATIPSHNTKEAVDAASIIAFMIFYLRKGYSKEEVFEKLSLNPTCIPFSKFNITCSETLNNCLSIFLHSNSFEETIYNMLLMGGDTDTNCCIVGSLAEACYGVDEALKRKVEEKIPKEFVKVLQKDNS